MKKLLNTGILLLLTCTVFSQSFEGTIEFKKIKGNKSTSYIYYIKQHLVRLEEYGAKKTIVDLAIINTKENKVNLLSPERRTYMEVHTKPSTKDMKNTKVRMTQESKTIMGKPCKKWIVENPDYNSRVTYWVTKGDYYFFPGLLTAINRKDHHALFYQQVPDAGGYFPMVSEETTLDGQPLGRLEVTNIEKKTMNSKFFEIPDTYSKIDN